MTDLSPSRLPRTFFARPARVVAQDLLGKLLVREIDGSRVSGIVVETEAYCDSEEPDLACHGTRNQGRPTPRTEVMFGPAGHAYVYFTYGMHWMLNVVTGAQGQANAVLLRALEPREGEAHMAAQRAPRPRAEWTNGPAKLAQALSVDSRLNGTDFCAPGAAIWFEEPCQFSSPAIRSGPRIGLGKTPEPWRSIAWRYWIAGNAFVSR